ncbi:YegS/Rv2252/BmrU family lipid kinase [Microbacterium halimionae]|uniref:YegS/Rv2252/BmrU family lipid kinase n=1 Tax=Microbacterium halimionae TaxID=1526413 RepID=A0A7W3JM87_9MICO|nr:diacylglycerol kinase family protein [Microbacterium halimionae]MBA8815454.1 YegS/Rv2252/BmrU family lipid kinase [Microbacterium halimionae]NII95501.1 YegS/Rv2252/BmrU family lipid kinase [Microbacterium halimionae]
MTNSRIGVVINPSKLDRGDLEDLITKTLKAAGKTDSVDVQWFETTEDDPGLGQGREAVEAGCDLVIAAGGDGTVRAVSEALAGTGVELGIVPRGTGNLFARNLGIPLVSMRAAVKRALTGTASDIDVGWVTVDDSGKQEAFVVMVGFGIDAQMLAETDSELKARAGWMAYVEAMGRAVAASASVEATLTIDGGKPEKLRAHTVLVGNCGMIQGGITLMPDAKPDDGRLDMIVVSAENGMQWMETLRSVVWDNGLIKLLMPGENTSSNGSLQHRTATSMRLELPSPQPFEIDGEEVGEVACFEVTLQPGALRVR